MQFHFQTGIGRVIVYEPFKGMIHYVNQETSLIASIGPLQSHEVTPEEQLSLLMEEAQNGYEEASDET